MTDPVAVIPINYLRSHEKWCVKVGPLQSEDMTYAEAEALAAEVRAYIEQCTR